MQLSWTEGEMGKLGRGKPASSRQCLDTDLKDPFHIELPKNFTQMHLLVLYDGTTVDFISLRKCHIRKWHHDLPQLGHLRHEAVKRGKAETEPCGRTESGVPATC